MHIEAEQVKQPGVSNRHGALGTPIAQRFVTSGGFGFSGYWQYAGWRPYFYYFYPHAFVEGTAA